MNHGRLLGSMSEPEGGKKARLGGSIPGRMKKGLGGKVGVAFAVATGLDSFDDLASSSFSMVSARWAKSNLGVEGDSDLMGEAERGDESESGEGKMLPDCRCVVCWRRLENICCCCRSM